MSSPGPPRRGSRLSRAFARGVLHLFGWRIAGDLPAIPRAVVIAAPHTSNWDFPVCMMAMFAYGVRISFIAKHTLFFFPARYILRWMGGEPVDRSVRSGRIAASIARLAEAEQLYLGFTPEGTRKRVEEWKTGFWAIADGAGVPIIPILLDWSRRELRISEAFHTTGDPVGDIRALRRRYRSEMARRADNFASVA